MTLKNRIAALEARSKPVVHTVILPDEEAMSSMSDEELQALCDDVIINEKPHQLPELEKLSDGALKRLTTTVEESDRKARIALGMLPREDEELSLSSQIEKPLKTQSIEECARLMPRNDYYREMAALAALPAKERRARFGAVSSKLSTDTSAEWSGYTDAELIHIFMAADGSDYYRGV